MSNKQERKIKKEGGKEEQEGGNENERERDKQNKQTIQPYSTITSTNMRKKNPPMQYTTIEKTTKKTSRRCGCSVSLQKKMRNKRIPRE